MSKNYSGEFFSLHLKQSIASAEQIIPVVMDYAQPGSVIDIGCGIGTWISVWKKKGMKVMGVDGNYVKKEQLLVDQSEFISHDLTKEFKSDKRYDLVCSMEVGEHIPASSADNFVNSLTSLGNVILFSAAIPGQDGTFHVNEQYPDYWAGLFAQRGYVAIDCIRERVWNNEEIAWWYRQNALFFVKKEVLSSYPKLESAYQHTGGTILPLVHPQLLKIKSSQAKYFRANLHNPFRAAGYYLKKIVGK